MARLTEEEKEQRARENPLTGTATRIYNKNFDIFRSNVCHLLHNRGDIEFINIIMSEGLVTQFLAHGDIAWGLYMLAMLDYVSRENDIPICKEYEPFRSIQLEELYIPFGIYLSKKLLGDSKIFDEAYKIAIPEFLRHNIMEGDVRNVC